MVVAPAGFPSGHLAGVQLPRHSQLRRLHPSSSFTMEPCSVLRIPFIVHFFTHIATLTIDPADASVRAKQSYSSPMPLFDRAKQPHVIQDLQCCLCDIKVGPKVKHCGVCNKCVEDFDHHCKWLNTCVGGRNYWWFFAALCSGTLGVFLLVVVIIFIFIQHYLDPNSLRTAPQFDSMLGNGTWLMFLPLAPIKTTSAGLLILAFVTIMLSITCLLLLAQLLGFHFYLFHKGISTYDYTKIQRQKEARISDIEAGNPHDSKIRNRASQNQVSQLTVSQHYPRLQVLAILKIEDNSPAGFQSPYALSWKTLENQQKRGTVFITEQKIQQRKQGKCLWETYKTGSLTLMKRPGAFVGSLWTVSL
nr:probable palmitoyltransferase ZDHHC11 isoform X2 [Labrus bergylta]